jgi:CRP-like cAMP-binding protein
LAVPAQNIVIQEGTAGAEAFVTVRGELEVKRSQAGKELVLARLGSGALFGEMALLSRAPRAASVVACRPSILLVARAAELDAVAAHKPEIGRVFADHCRRRMVENVVRTSPLLAAISPGERPGLLERFETRIFEQGERLISQDQKADGLHLLASGEVQVVTNEPDGRTALTRLGPGEVVGEVALVLRKTANADVVARYPTITLYLREERFFETIRSYPSLLLALYELAVTREVETRSIVAQEAADIDDHVLL